MPGLAIAAASSAAWAVMGAQAETALNSGWILDQRQDGAGGFLSNASPLSSVSFISTGDATPFWVVGRAFKAITTTGGAPSYTSVGTVGQSSFAGGITTVFVNQFSTAAGLSTALSTGVVTNVAASPVFPRSTDNNTFGGLQILSSTGGQPTAVSPGLLRGSTTLSGFSVGSDAAHFRIDSAGAVGVEFRTVDNSDAITGMTMAKAAIGSSPASSGFVRLPNSAIALVGKTSTGGDDIVWPMQFQSTTLTAQIFSSGAGGTNIFSKSLAVGTWWISAGLTVQDTGSANVGAAIAINNGTTDLFTQQTAFNQIIGTTGPSGSLSISGIVSHTTALTYNIVLFGHTTTLKAVPAGGGWSGFGGSTAASWFNAVKIG